MTIFKNIWPTMRPQMNLQNILWVVLQSNSFQIIWIEIIYFNLFISEVFNISTVGTPGMELRSRSWKSYLLFARILYIFLTQWLHLFHYALNVFSPKTVYTCPLWISARSRLRLLQDTLHIFLLLLLSTNNENLIRVKVSSHIFPKMSCPTNSSRQFSQLQFFLRCW